MADPDVFKILKDLEAQIVGLDEQSKKMQEGFFVSYRPVGLPIRADTYKNPWNPFGASIESKLNQPVQVPETKDPKDAPKTDMQALQDEETAKKIQKTQNQMFTFYNTFLLVDDQLVMNNQYQVMPKAASIHNAWWAIITGANGIPTLSELKPEMKQAYEDAKAILMDKDDNPTKHYEDYMKYEDDYKSKVRKWNTAYTNYFMDPLKAQRWPIDGKLYHEDADEAWDRWSSFGHKEEIEKAIATLSAQGTDPAIALVARDKKIYQNSLVEMAGQEVPYILIQPNDWYDKDVEDGWMTYSSDAFHSESHYKASATSYSAGGGFSLGFWSASGGYSHREGAQSLDWKSDNLSVSLKYMAADIKRPWLDTSLMNLKSWFLMGDYKKGCISNGTMGQICPDNAPMFLPAIVTSLILIKDLHIKWATAESDWKKRQLSNQANVSVGWGPFCVHGSYSHSEEEQDITADYRDGGLFCTGIQLLGYISAILPFCPGHDSSEFLQKPKENK